MFTSRVLSDENIKENHVYPEYNLVVNKQTNNHCLKFRYLLHEKTKVLIR